MRQETGFGHYRTVATVRFAAWALHSLRYATSIRSQHLTTAVDLHDASLEAVRFDWKTRACSFEFHGSPSRPNPFSLTFVEVSALQIPASLPWGPSVSVLEFRSDGSGRFEFEMQSGDTLALVSASSSFEIVAVAR